MRILLVHYRYYITGGPERYLFNVKKALEDDGHEVVPFSIATSRNVETEYASYFVRNIGNSDEVFVNKYPKTLRTYLDLIDREFYSYSVRKKLESLIREVKPDVCYLLVYKRALSPSVIDACKKYNVPVVNRISDYNTVCGAGSLYRDGNICLDCLKKESACFKYKCIKGSALFSGIRFLSIKFHKMLRFDKKIDAYICTNEYMKKRMQEYGYSYNKLHVIPTFFGEDAISESMKAPNLPDANCINFLFIGNIDETKGIYDLLDALGKLVVNRTNFKLYIVGGLHAEENQKVQNIISKNGLNNHIEFVPFLKGKEVYNYYLKANVTILPARWVENLPNTLIESLYFGRPVVVPNFGSFIYTASDDVAYKYEALSSHSLAVCLEDICRNSESIIEKSKNCAGFYRKNYGRQEHMKKLELLLAGVQR